MSTASVQLGSQLVPLAGAVAEPRSLDFSEQLQRDHYDEIADEYEAHYSDACSLDYRRQFIYRPMFEGLNLSGMNGPRRYVRERPNHRVLAEKSG